MDVCNESKELVKCISWSGWKGPATALLWSQIWLFNDNTPDSSEWKSGQDNWRWDSWFRSMQIADIAHKQWRWALHELKWKANFYGGQVKIGWWGCAQQNQGEKKSIEMILCVTIWFRFKVVCSNSRLIGERCICQIYRVSGFSFPHELVYICIYIKGKNHRVVGCRQILGNVIGKGFFFFFPSHLILFFSKKRENASKKLFKNQISTHTMKFSILLNLFTREVHHVSSCQSHTCVSVHLLFNQSKIVIPIQNLSVF